MTIRRRFQLKRYPSIDAIEADEYRYWQGVADYRRIAAVSKITSVAYRLKDARTNVSRLQRTLVRIER